MVISAELTCTFSCVVITIYQVGCGSSIMTPHFIFDSLWLNLIRKVREVSHQFWLLYIHADTSVIPVFCVFIEAAQPSFVVVFSYIH